MLQTLAEAPSNLQIDIRIHVTGLHASDGLQTLEKTPQRGSTTSSDEDLQLPSPGGSKSGSCEKETLDSELELAKYKNVHTARGRLDVRSILGEEISCASGPVSVDGKSISF